MALSELEKPRREVVRALPHQPFGAVADVVVVKGVVTDISVRADVQLPAQAFPQQALAAAGLASVDGLEGQQLERLIDVGVLPNELPGLGFVAVGGHSYVPMRKSGVQSYAFSHHSCSMVRLSKRICTYS